MKKELKKSIKEDEVVSGIQSAIAWVMRNRRLAQNVSMAAAALIAVGWGVSAWQSYRTREAAAAFLGALEIYLAPVRSELPQGAPAPAGLAFDSAPEKYKKAAAAFDGVERRYGTDRVGLRARYFGALSRAAMGETAEAQRQLEQVAAQKSGFEPALAQWALVELWRKGGQADKAAESLRKLAADPDWPLPKDAALMALGRALEEAKKLEEARSAYQRLADEYPTSVYAAEARSRVASLATAG